MSLQVAVAFNAIRSPLTRDAVAGLARKVLNSEGMRHAELSIALVDPKSMAELNENHLGHAGTTDVISFGFLPSHEGAPLVGDIYICPDVARGNARTHGCSLREEIARLVIHGTLHVLGHDHPEGSHRMESPMWQRQEALLQSWLEAVAA
ncbi:MAG TPA: rRNA maturation RNase YbeY [Gemmatimonadales bacterium]|nr:rRNA maturation RNase YbeY [Gemmatimonadales bacterium]